MLVACVAAVRRPRPPPRPGPEQTAKFVKTVENTNKGIREAREQIQKTVDIYNSIVDVTAKDNKSAYKDLVNAQGDCEKMAAAHRSQGRRDERRGHDLLRRVETAPR